MTSCALPVSNLLQVVGHAKALSGAAVPYLPTSRPGVRTRARTRAACARKHRLDTLGGWVQPVWMRLPRALPHSR